MSDLTLAWSLVSSLILFLVCLFAPIFIMFWEQEQERREREKRDETD